MPAWGPLALLELCWFLPWEALTLRTPITQAGQVPCSPFAPSLKSNQRDAFWRRKRTEVWLSGLKHASIPHGVSSVWYRRAANKLLRSWRNCYCRLLRSPRQLGTQSRRAGAGAGAQLLKWECEASAADPFRRRGQLPAQREQPAAGAQGTSRGRSPLGKPGEGRALQVRYGRGPAVPVNSVCIAQGQGGASESRNVRV